MGIVEDARQYAVDEIEKTGLPDIHVFEISEKKAIELADKLQADKTTTLVGYYLMDLKLGEAFKQGKIKEHIKMSSDAAKIFLEKYNLDEESKNKIMNCIEAHHKAIPFSCKEAEICANADCYRFLALKGFLHSVISMEKLLGFDKMLKTREAKIDEKWAILSIPECKEELEENYKLLKELLRKAREE